MTRKHNLPTIKGFFELGRASGHDALDISEDPEALVALANATWNRLVEDPCIDKLTTWIEAVDDISKRVTEGPILDWLNEQWAKASVMADRVFQDLDSQIHAEHAREQMTHARKRMSSSDFHRIALSVEPTIAHFLPKEEAELL